MTCTMSIVLLNKVELISSKWLIMESAYFKDIRCVLQDLLLHSENDVQIAMAWFTSMELFETLRECLKRGVHVHLLLLDDVINWQPYAPDFDLLKNEGANIRVFEKSNRFMHNKFCVIDHTIAITGSYNWTYYAENRNAENIVVLSNAKIVSLYELEFSRLWDVSGGEIRHIDWSDLADDNDYNIFELQQEVHAAAITRHLPEQTIIRIPDPIIIDKKKTPVSTVNIGLQVDDDKMDVLIAKKMQLPYTITRTYFINRDISESDIVMRLFVGESFTASHNEKIASLPLAPILEGCHSYPIRIQMKVTLDDFAFITAEVECIETHEVMLAKAERNIKLVGYDN